MPNRVRALTCSADDFETLESIAGDPSTPRRLAGRVRIVLLAARGLAGKDIAARVGCSEPTVIRWRRRYAEYGLVGLDDQPRPGRPRLILPDTRDEILTVTLTERPREGGTRWSSRLLAAELGRRGHRVSHASVARVWREFGLEPQRTATFRIFADTGLEARVQAVVAVYSDRVDRAVVLLPGEVQARPRLRTGQGPPPAPRRRRDFLAFLAQVGRAHPGREFDVVVVASALARG